MRRAILEVSPQFYARLAKQLEVHVTIEKGLPDDAKLINTRYDFDRDMIQFVFESETFEDVAEGGKMPTLPEVWFTEVA